MGVRLKLKAGDPDDLSVISSLVQDALAPFGDMKFLESDNSFVLAISRFCWERRTGNAPPHLRNHSGLRFDNVRAVARKGIQPHETTKMLSLLTVAYAPDDPEGKSAAGPGAIVLQFSGNVAIRLTVSDICCAMEDLGDPWPTMWQPEHNFQTA